MLLLPGEIDEGMGRGKRERQYRDDISPMASAS